MPLHRDIHWIGRQWAVTGHGMQLIDQKLQGFFDVEVSRLWDDVLIEALHDKEWLNIADFDKGLAIARARYPQPASVATPPAEAPRPLAIKPATPIAEVAKPAAPKPEAPRVETLKLEKPNPIEPLRAAASKPEAPKREQPDPVEPPPAVAKLQAPAIATPAPAAPPSQPLTLFQMRYEGRARFVRPWRVVARKF
jgi:hypothetical protein